ncbi:MAG TPA: hypothetical protein VLC71_06110 [Thermomonas sp.]|nr:hypothetical protein [Thermomonas sp.]
MHENDILAGLEHAIKNMRAEAEHDTLVRLTYLPALQELRDRLQREARGA